MNEVLDAELVRDPLIAILGMKPSRSEKDASLTNITNISKESNNYKMA